MIGVQDIVGLRMVLDKWYGLWPQGKGVVAL